MNLQSGMPVLYCTIAGDQEGRTIKSLGYYSGRIEDILRLVAPKARKAQPRSDAVDYELSVCYYGSPEEVCAHLSSQCGLDENERHPEIVSVQEQRPIGKTVEIYVDEVQQLIIQLHPATHHERINYSNGTPSNYVRIDL